MYCIYVDDDILYHPLLSSEGRAITSGRIDLELDKTGSATISIPQVNPLYGSINKMKSMVRITDDEEEIFRGRVLHDNRDFANNRKMYVEGELAFMIDNILSPYDNTVCASWQPFITWLGRAFNGTAGDFFRYYVYVYNTQVESNKRYTIGTVNASAAGTAATISNKDYPTIWDEINKKLIDTYGGHIRTRLTNGVRYIDWLNDYDHICGQPIEFGQNLLDINDYTSAENVVTVLIPLGKDLGGATGRVNITSVNDGQLQVANDTARDIFGNIWEARIWDEITDPTTLKALGIEYLTRVANPLKTMTIKAVDLNFAGIETDKIRLGDKIRVISDPHGINSLYQCTKMSIDLINPANSTYTFGDIPNTLTGQSAYMEAEIGQANSAASKADQKADSSAAAALIEAKAYADTLVLGASNAYESDRTKATDEATASALYSDLLDEVTVKVYKTVNGESRYKLGLMAQDIDTALTQLQLAERPILSGTTVDYDELVAVLWQAVQDLRDRVSTLENGG